MTSPSARVYTVADVCWRLRDHLQLRAMLWPLTGRYKYKEGIAERLLKIRRWWWYSLHRLHKRGWAPITKDPRVYHNAQECPVTCLIVRGKPRCCNLGTACPFCWARRAAKWWDRVDDAFFRNARQRGP